MLGALPENQPRDSRLYVKTDRSLCEPWRGHTETQRVKLREGHVYWHTGPNGTWKHIENFYAKWSKCKSKWFWGLRKKTFTPQACDFCHTEDGRRQMKLCCPVSMKIWIVFCTVGPSCSTTCQRGSESSQHEGKASWPEKRPYDLKKNLDSDIFCPSDPSIYVSKLLLSVVSLSGWKSPSDRCSQLCIHCCSLASESIYVLKWDLWRCCLLDSELCTSPKGLSERLLKSRPSYICGFVQYEIVPHVKAELDSFMSGLISKVYKAIQTGSEMNKAIV